MKILSLSSVFFLIISPSCFNTKSSTNNSGDPYLFSKTNVSDEVLRNLKETKTIFYYGNESGLTLDSLKTAVTSAWDLTPIVFESIDRYFDFAGEKGYSCFVIEGGRTGANFTNERGQHSMSVTNTHLYLVLRPYNEFGLCRIELFPDSKTLLSDDYDHFKYSTAYKKGHFYNWSPVYLKAHLEEVSHDLKNNTRPDLFEKYASKNLQELLTKDTLYISEELLNKYNSFSGSEKNDRDNIFTSFKTPYKICSDEELYDIFITQKRGRFLLEYVKSSSFKFIKIFDMKNKEVLYKDTDKGYNLTAKDISRIYR